MGCSHSAEVATKPTKQPTPPMSNSRATAVSTDSSFGRTALATRRAVGVENCGANHRPRQSPDDADPSACNWNLRFSEMAVSEHIANGGYCTVLACTLNGEKRAVKIPLANCTDPEGAIADLTNEIRILRRLRHPHLCSVYGAGGWTRQGDLPFLVLERLQYKNLAQQCGTDVDDTSLRAKLRQRRLRATFPFKKRLRYALQLAQVLRYLHDESVPGGFIVHRDLKPSNIGISEDGTLKVFDFGLARVREQRDPLTDRYVMTGQTGSQRFMAPEVFDGMPYNEKVDMYSYGVVLWELCSLQKPFAGMSPYQHARKVFKLGMRPALDPRWPRQLQELIDGCWHAEPDYRPDAWQAVEVLSDIIESGKNAGSKRGTPLYRL